MKKIILAAAIAAVLAPLSAVADTKVYGAIRTSALLAGENGGADLGGLVNNASRLGVKGSYGDEGGLTGFFNIQGGLDTDTGGGTGFSSRFAMAGVKGGFGTAVVGRLSSPYKMAGLKLDPFYDTSAGVNNGGSNYGLSNLTNGWLNNVVGYISPKLGGAFTINAVAVLGKNDNNALIPNKNFFNPGVTYSANGVTAAIQHVTEIKATRYSVGYKAGPMSAGLSFEDLDGDDEALHLAGTYKVTPRTTLAASYGSMDIAADAARNVDGDGFTLGVFQKVAPKTTITAIYSDVDATNNANDRDVFALGLIQKF